MGSVDGIDQSGLGWVGAVPLFAVEELTLASNAGATERGEDIPSTLHGFLVEEAVVATEWIGAEILAESKDSEVASAEVGLRG
jgi:hypothetical protein